MLWLRRLFEHPATVPGLVVLMVLSRMRGIAVSRDLTSGDTSHYFLDLTRWLATFEWNLAWSPLYTAFSGIIHAQTADPYATLILIRVVSALVLAALTGLLLRQCLSPGVALLAGAWWARNPVVFDTLYEIHLFSALGPVAALWLTVRFRTPRGRAAALALLGIWAALQRNEYSLAVLVAGAVFLWRDVWRNRQWAAYATAAALFAATLAAAYSLSWVRFPVLTAVLAEKHTVNLCQIYAFGYQQRNPAWQSSAWTECSSLMQTTFGAPLPALWQATASNWRAIATHFGWNVLLAPAGVQLLLFGAKSVPGNPDYVPVADAAWVTAGAVALLLLWLLGGAVLWRDGRIRQALHQHWAAAAMAASLLLSTAVVPVIQRPRPSYMLAAGVILVLAAALVLDALLCRMRAHGLVSCALPVAGLLLVPLMPAYYTPERFPYRPALTEFRRLEGFRDALQGRKPLSPGFAADVCRYLSEGGKPACEGVVFGRALAASVADFQTFLVNTGIQAIYLDRESLALPALRAWAERRAQSGWTTLATGAPSDPWILAITP
jgi:hypothetical protein